jgi:hypothetical protein
MAPGECLYLVGAPPGAPAAETEERVEGSSVETGCTLPHGVDLNRDGENMIQAWVSRDPGVPFGQAVCALEGWVGHELTAVTEAEAPFAAWITMSGGYAGLLENAGGSRTNTVRLGVRLVESPAGERTVVAQQSVYVREVEVANPPVEPAAAFSARLRADLMPGRSYAVELSLWLDGQGAIESLDFGQTGAERFARYDRVEVCSGPASSGASPGTEALERDLYEGRCMPSLWMPADAGGRLDEARDLVALRLSQAAATAAPGVNERVASRRLAEADAQAVGGDYQAACRSLVQGLRALTTP